MIKIELEFETVKEAKDFLAAGEKCREPVKATSKEIVTGLNQRAEAIKMLKRRTGCVLSEAKEEIDDSIKYVYSVFRIALWDYTGKTATEWEKIMGVEVLDRDGWAHEPQNGYQLDKITLFQFLDRAKMSTCDWSKI
jgi:hypothetical protein